MSTVPINGSRNSTLQLKARNLSIQVARKRMQTFGLFNRVDGIVCKSITHFTHRFRITIDIGGHQRLLISDMATQFASPYR